MKIQEKMPSEWGEWETPKQFEGDLPTLKLNPHRELCPCGDWVEGRTINCSYIQLQKYNPRKALSQSCSVCKKWYNPVEDEWIDTPHGARRAILCEHIRRKAK